VRLDNTADIVKDRYFLFPTWCYVKRIYDALFDVVTNMSVHKRILQVFGTMYDCIQVYEMQWYSATADRLCNVKRAVTETGYSKTETTCRLNLSTCLISHGTMFLSHNKSANSTFQRSEQSKSN